jgi:hypothetical protein
VARFSSVPAIRRLRVPAAGPTGIPPGAPSRRRRQGLELLAAGLLCAVIGLGQGAAHAATGSPVKWVGPAGIPTAMTNGGSPALATYQGHLYAAWQGQSSPYHIWYSAYSDKTNTWSVPATVPSALTNYRTGPTLAVYNGDLYVAWQGQGSPIGIWYASFNGTSWSKQARVPAALVHISSTVGLAAYNGDLYLTWTGQSSPYAVWYASFNGTTWSPQHTIPATSSDNFQATDTPLAACNGLLYVSWETGSTSILQYATFNGTSWSAPVSRGVSSTAGPALAVKGTKLYESWINFTNTDVEWASFNGTSWTAPKAIPKASIFIGLGPALATYDGALYDAWAPDPSPSAIEYSLRA